MRHSTFSDGEKEILEVLEILNEKEGATVVELAELYNEKTGKEIDAKKLAEMMSCA